MEIFEQILNFIKAELEQRRWITILNLLFWEWIELKRKRKQTVKRKLWGYGIIVILCLLVVQSVIAGKWNSSQTDDKTLQI